MPRIVFVALGAAALILVPGGSASAQASECALALEERLAQMRLQVDSNPASAFSEAIRILHLRTPGSACARAEVVRFLGTRRAEDAVVLLLGVIRSDPDPSIRELVMQQLANTVDESPALHTWLDQRAPIAPLREGMPGVVIVRGSVSNARGVAMPAAPVAVGYHPNGCDGAARGVIRTTSGADGSYEVAFLRVGERERACVEASVASTRARSVLPPASELKTDTLRVDFKVPR